MSIFTKSDLTRIAEYLEKQIGATDIDYTKSATRRIREAIEKGAGGGGSMQNYYTKDEVNAMMNTIEHGERVIVDALPAEGDPKNIYLVPKIGEAGFTEWVYISNGNWEPIGDSSTDLSNYFTKDQILAMLEEKQNILTEGANIDITDNVVSLSLSKNDILTLLGYEEHTITVNNSTLAVLGRVVE